MQNHSRKDKLINNSNLDIPSLSIIKIPSAVTMPELDIVDFVYPQARTEQKIDPDAGFSSSILCSRNVQVDAFNTLIQETLETPQQPITTLYSCDRPNKANEEERDQFSHAFLDQMNARDVTPHTLRLRVGDLVFLMRNYSQKDKLTNNSKHMVLDINKRRKMITIRNLATQEIQIIHRITFSVDVSSRKRNTINFVLERRQFPLRLCYAMTIDKSQGQSLRRVGLDLREQVFSHGQLYVAFGRVSFKEDILTLVTDQARSISEPGTCTQQISCTRAS